METPLTFGEKIFILDTMYEMAAGIAEVAQHVGDPEYRPV